MPARARSPRCRGPPAIRRSTPRPTRPARCWWAGWRWGRTRPRSPACAPRRRRHARPRWDRGMTRVHPPVRGFW